MMNNKTSMEKRSSVTKMTKNMIKIRCSYMQVRSILREENKTLMMKMTSKINKISRIMMDTVKRTMRKRVKLLMQNSKCNSKWPIISCKIFNFKVNNSKTTDRKIKKILAKTTSSTIQISHRSSTLNTNSMNSNKTKMATT